MQLSCIEKKFGFIMYIMHVYPKVCLAVISPESSFAAVTAGFCQPAVPELNPASWDWKCATQSNSESGQRC